MTHDVTYSTFKPADIWPVSMRMRESDREELKASYGACPLSALIASTQASSLKWSIVRGDEVIGICGVGAASLFSLKGSPWMLATPAIEEVSMGFLRQSRGCVQRMLEQHSFLENWVDARNVTSIRWLKWCGFSFDDPAPFGVEQRMFHRFEMRK